jgi:hypothetical protein
MFHLPALPAALCAAILVQPSPVDDRVPLDELIRSGQLAVVARGTGTHSGGSVRLVVRNTSGSAVRTRIPAGWVFPSVQEDVQDLMVVRNEELTLAGGTSRTILCRAFCIEGPMRGPSEGEAYRSGGMGRPALSSLAQVVAAGKYDDDVVQAAVWVLSNGYSIAGMGALDSSATDTLRMAVSRASGQPPPRYTMRFVQEEGRVCTGRPSSIVRDFSLNAPAGTVFTAVVVDAAGHVVRTLEYRTLLEPGQHVRHFEVPVLDWPSGRYAIHAYTSNGPGVHRMPFVL